MLFTFTAVCKQAATLWINIAVFIVKEMSISQNGQHINCPVSRLITKEFEPLATDTRTRATS